jgi:UDP-N-acetyl-2-amino-2-deoxyglucuronate dehydrogenase
MEKVRIGILGGGGILGAHGPAFAAMQDKATVVVVAEPNPAREPAIRKWFGPGVRIVGDYHEVIASSDVDAVDIILPHDLHMPATLAAAAARKPVLVEKVMARNVYECDRMIEACEKAGVSLTVCHDRRYHADWMVMKDLVDSGVLGNVFYWKLEHNQNVPFPPGHWARTKDGIGGGAIMSCLTHQIDALRWYGGEVASVTSMTHTIPARMEGEFAGIMAARMASGALAQLSINWWTRSNGTPNGLWYELNHACGPRGEAYYMHGKGTHVLLHEHPAHPPAGLDAEKAMKEFVKVESGKWNGHVGCISEWVKSLHGEESHIVTSGREARGTVEVAEAAYRSEETGRTVSLPIEPRPWAGKESAR